MSTRTTTRTRTSSHQAHQHILHPTLPLQRTSSKPGSSRPGTPSRGDIPFSRKISSATHKSPVPLQHLQLPMSDQPTTPTPKKSRRPRRGNKPANQRNVAVGSEPELPLDQEPSSEDEEMLFDLLGVMSPPKPSPKRGVLNLSKDDMDVALGKKNQPRNAGKVSGAFGQGEIKARDERSPAPQGRVGRNQPKQDSVENGAEGETMAAIKSKRGKKTSKPPRTTDDISGHVENNLKPKSGISATRPKNISKQPSASQASNHGETQSLPFDTSSLSKSLPSRGLAHTQSVTSTKKGKKAVGSEDESAVWEMPLVAGGQELTWQQKLQSPVPSPSESPRKSSRSTPSDKKKTNLCIPYQAVPPVPSPLNPRPTHNRRASADGPPLSGTGARTVSAFDSHIPFHTGFNVHRAPQTPAKSVASAHGNLSNGILPIVGTGEFPRIPNDFAGRKGSLSSSSGPSSNPLGAKYAGPTFHNSPNASSLSKPDLEDF
ncbi:uncharacterized protein I206_107443 [Kwoniella pini CBS 10737]|uniref:Uncharacterized protein n=1 Tax=Kwoniella pini CBS 10737 TaxID=1296096 RepID=A0A1B9HXA5_9TREE|nr:uncharacterized protein I206_05771 [Kwoniella pini CBS 10737]OCF47907.1 hypothetical protein I206_05771 [Kwoniella pini CBS 10737]